MKLLLEFHLTVIGYIKENTFEDNFLLKILLFKFMTLKFITILVIEFILLFNIFVGFITKNI